MSVSFQEAPRPTLSNCFTSDWAVAVAGGKLASPSLSLPLLSVLLSQVEYGPCVVASDCWSLLLEFLQSFLGSHAPGAPTVFGNRHDAVYGPADTMIQYMELFNKIRKQQQVPVAGIR